MIMRRRIFIEKLIISLSFIILFPIIAKANDTKTPDIGEKAPDFILDGYNKYNPKKVKWSLDDFHGKWIILYFYPKDFTNGCTIEARGFKTMKDEYKSLNTEVIGLSMDTKDDHESFCNSEELGFTLLSDYGGKVSKQYGSWSPPFSSRNTFLINPDGLISFKWIDVKPISHAKQVLSKIKELQEGSNA